jgi:hypothetical protein
VSTGGAITAAALDTASTTPIYAVSSPWTNARKTEKNGSIAPSTAYNAA